ncbi:MAG: 2-dehydropantoate 2-reductase [Deltaproteobacteria bacterium]|nr:2-dehydropantoate 2-reductase [Deltaproteobacteria bacterium]MBW2308222.1 2-dehydropantoate 2-reductase [Deltaproteobacteria bacterium]
MAITIYGAGAIGGLTGAYLARAGEDVLMVDKVVEHVHAMNRRGLKITGAAEFTVPIRACLPEELRGPLGLVFLAVKSQDTDAALDVIAPQVGPDTILVSLQNGMNPPRIAARIGSDKVVAAFVNFGADWHGPGHIEHGGPGGFYLGEIDGSLTDRIDRLQRLLSNVHSVHVTDNIFGYLWAKQIDCSLLFAQAVTDETMADVFSNKRFQPLLIALLGEGVMAARAAGVRLESFDTFEPLKMQPSNEDEMAAARAVLDRFADRCRSRVKVRSGPWRDLAVRRRPTEIDHLVGWVISEGKKRGIAMPLNEHLVAQVKEIEQGKRRRGLHNLEDLEHLRKVN